MKKYIKGKIAREMSHKKKVFPQENDIRCKGSLRNPRTFRACFLSAFM